MRLLTVSVWLKTCRLGTFFFLSILLHKVILFFILELKSCKSKLRSSNSMRISDDDCSVLNKTNY